MRNDALASLFNRVDYCLLVPREDGAEVDNFTGDASLFGHGDSHADLSQLQTVTNYSEISTFLEDLSLA